MPKKQFIVAWLAGIFLLNGCVTINSIHKHAEKVNYSDGINRHEALWLARKDCFHDPECYSVSEISFPSLYQDKNYPHEWIIKFGTFCARNYRRVIRIDKVTGKITRGYFSWWEYHWVE